MPFSNNKPLKYTLLFLSLALAIGIPWFTYFDKSPEIVNEVKENKIEVKEPVVETKTDDVSKTEDVTNNKQPVIETKVELPKGQELINLYYQRLAEGKLDEAYAMKKYKTMDLSVFKGWYKELKATSFLDFIEVAPNQYDFLVQLENNDGSKEKYRVWMQIEGNLLNTIFSTSTNESPDLRFVYGEEGDITTLFLVTKGSKKTIDTAKKSKYEEFNNVEISYGGDYLIYFKTGAESNGGKVYDIAAGKVIHDIGPTRDLAGFTNDMKHFYNCIGSGLFGGEVKTYSVPSFNLEKDLMNNLQVNNCDGYDKKTNTLKYTLSQYINGTENKHSYSYNFNNGTVNAL